MIAQFFMRHHKFTPLLKTYFSLSEREKIKNVAARDICARIRLLKPFWCLHSLAVVWSTYSACSTYSVITHKGLLYDENVHDGFGLEDKPNECIFVFLMVSGLILSIFFLFLIEECILPGA